MRGICECQSERWSFCYSSALGFHVNWLLRLLLWKNKFERARVRWRCSSKIVAQPSNLLQLPFGANYSGTAFFFSWPQGQDLSTKSEIKTPPTKNRPEKNQPSNFAPRGASERLTSGTDSRLKWSRIRTVNLLLLTLIDACNVWWWWWWCFCRVAFPNTLLPLRSVVLH